MGQADQLRHFNQVAANAGRTLSRTSAQRQVRYGRIVRETVKKVVSTILDAINAICSETTGVLFNFSDLTKMVFRWTIAFVYILMGETDLQSDIVALLDSANVCLTVPMF